jgi:hypothetical protein
VLRVVSRAVPRRQAPSPPHLHCASLNVCMCLCLSLLLFVTRLCSRSSTCTAGTCCTVTSSPKTSCWGDPPAPWLSWATLGSQRCWAVTSRPPRSWVSGGTAQIPLPASCGARLGCNVSVRFCVTMGSMCSPCALPSLHFGRHPSLPVP